MIIKPKDIVKENRLFAVVTRVSEGRVYGWWVEDYCDALDILRAFPMEGGRSHSLDEVKLVKRHPSNEGPKKVYKDYKELFI